MRTYVTKGEVNGGVVIRVVVVLWCGDKTLSGGGWLRYGKKVSQAYPQPRRDVSLHLAMYSPFHSFIAFSFITSQVNNALVPSSL
jgi:hypothetical protein